MKKVAVIGAGISGLCVAFRAQKAGADVSLFDAAGQVGGNIHTVTNGAYTYEHGPNSLTANGEIFELIDDLGLGDKVLATKPAAKTRYILRDGNPVALPGTITQGLTTKAFSIGGRLRILKEPFIGSKTSSTESVYEFIKRRIGREMADYAIDPFVSGIYAGDPRRLSLTNAFPKFHNLESTSGSLIRGALFGTKLPARPVPEGAPRMFSFDNGMQTLVDGIAEDLADARLQTPVERFEKQRWLFDQRREVRCGRPLHARPSNGEVRHRIGRGLRKADRGRLLSADSGCLRLLQKGPGRRRAGWLWHTDPGR